MTIAPPLLNALKALLVLGVGLGGHQIYWKLAGNYLDDGFFYFTDKTLLPNSDTLGKNKVYNSDSAITREQEWGNKRYFVNNRYNYHVGFKANSIGYTLDKLTYSGHSEKASVYKRIKDHTLKLAMPCQAGTGWLLDFEMPKGEEYPTKWFIATNLHVINMFRFKSNPYNAPLPVTDGYVDYLRSLPQNKLDGCYRSIIQGNMELKLFTEKDERDKNIYPEQQRYTDRSYYGSFIDIALNFFNPHRSWSHLEKPTVYTTTVKEPKLVYAAIDFLGPRYTVSGHQNTDVSYFKDFGVIEVNFANEKQARIMTNGAYDKYYKNGVENKDPINFFAPELMSKYNPTELANSTDKYYIGGYPGGVSENLSFDINTQVKVTPTRNLWGYYYRHPYDTELTSSKLTYFRKFNRQDELVNYNLLNNKGQVIPGHASIDKIDRISNDSKIMWNGRQLNGWGYNYLIDNTFLGKGASGSMVLNQDGDLLGLYRMYNSSFNYGFVEPLRASWVVDGKRIILPGFDLLTGEGDQVISYKTQLTKARQQTYLSSKSWNLKK